MSFFFCLEIVLYDLTISCAVRTGIFDIDNFHKSHIINIINLSGGGTDGRT